MTFSDRNSKRENCTEDEEVPMIAGLKTHESEDSDSLNRSWR
jgi:hypothetical protein